MARRLILACGVLALSVMPALAQDAEPRPEDGKRPSEILAAIEARPDFSHLEDMAWNDRGYYAIEYRTGDKARVLINIDAKSGQPVDD